MKDFLKDLIDHTCDLGGIDLIKITGTDQETQFNAVAEKKTVIVSGSFKTPIADFIGVFGMPNLGKLKTIIGLEDYSQEANITVDKQNRDGVDTPVTIHFETKNGDFVNDYRLMSKNIVTEKVGNVKFGGASWGVEFAPTIPGIQRLKRQQQANSEEKQFKMKTDGSDLKIYFGDVSTHSGSFVFQPGVSGSITGKNFSWPVTEFIAIMDLAGDKTVRVSDAGAIEIVVDSGIASYRYLIPAII